MSLDTRTVERLRGLLAPATTAVVTMELQRGVVGPEAMLPALVEQVATAGTADNAGRLCVAARHVGAQVVHCTAETRSDGAGAAQNCRLLAMAEKMRTQGLAPIEQGSLGARVVEQLGPEPGDIVVARIHGMTPFMSTSLDQILRNCGVTTIVVTGVSVNLGVLGLCLNAVDLGYQVVLASDAVTGVPADYAEAVIEHTLANIATVATTGQIESIWADDVTSRRTPVNG